MRRSKKRTLRGGLFGLYKHSSKIRKLFAQGRGDEVINLFNEFNFVTNPYYGNHNSSGCDGMPILIDIGANVREMLQAYSESGNSRCLHLNEDKKREFEEALLKIPPSN